MTRQLLAALVLVLVLAAPAAAEPVDVTAQAKASRATFLRDLAPPGRPAVICLVDTGTNETPDTTSVIGRLALEGDAHDHSPSMHGTRMAMFIAAPRNSFGMVGLWPAGQILSVRANVTGQDAFTPGGYIRGIRWCDEAAEANGVKVILLALSSNSELSEDERADIIDTVRAARAHGISVVAAAGNTAGGPIGAPANVDGVLSVAAYDAASGARCASSALGADLTSPGCGLDAADPATGESTISQGGTSAAAAIAAATLAALRSWRPGLSPDTAEGLLLDAAVPSSAGKRLDVEAAFLAAGLQSVVAAGETAVQPDVSIRPTPPPVESGAPRVTKRLPTPRLKARVERRGKRRSLVVSATNRPPAAVLTVRVYLRDRRQRWRLLTTRSARSSQIRVRHTTWDRVTGAYTDPSGATLPSRDATLRRAR